MYFEMQKCQVDKKLGIKNKLEQKLKLLKNKSFF